MCILNLERVIGTQTKLSSIKPGYLKTLVVVSGYKDTDVIFVYSYCHTFSTSLFGQFYYPNFRNTTHALSLSVLIAFKGSNFNFIILYTEYIHVYNIEAVIICSSLSLRVQSFWLVGLLVLDECLIE